MNFEFDERERARRDEVRAFVDEFGSADVRALREEMARLDVERHTPGFQRELGRRGWIGLGWPAPHGRPATESERYVLREELDAAGLPTYGLEIAEAIGSMLVRHGPPELAATHLPHIVDGSWNYAGAYSEPDAGSDLLALSTRAVRDGDAYRVNGSKLWTSGAHLADWIFALVRTEEGSTRHRGLSILLVDASSPGLSITPVPVLGGWRVNALFFDDVEVPASNRVGEENRGWPILVEALDAERSMSFGGREARLLLTRLLHRYEGRNADLREDQLARLGRLVAEIEVERLLNARVAAMGERGEPAGAAASMSKVYGSELAQRVVAWAAELTAPASQFVDGDDDLAADVEQALRAFTVLTVIGGTSEVQRNVVAGRGLGLPREG